MTNTFSKLVIFAAGALIGSAVTYKIMKDKYEPEYDEVIEEDDISESEEDEEDDSDIHKPVDLKEYANKIKEQGYVDYSGFRPAKEKEASDVDTPHVIPPEEFDTLDDYEGVTYTYYADGVLTDEMDNIVEDVDDVVGLDSLETFGEYEDDSVYVRNDKLKLDFEILRDARKYSDIVNTNPRLTEV